MAGKWTPHEVAGTIFVFDEDTPVILGSPEGVPLFVIPKDDGVFNAWEAGQQACEAHNAMLAHLHADMGRSEICESLEIYQRRFDSLCLLVRARRHAQVVDKARAMAAQVKALTSERDELASRLAEYLMAEKESTLPPSEVLQGNCHG